MQAKWALVPHGPSVLPEIMHMQDYADGSYALVVLYLWLEA